MVKKKSTPLGREVLKMLKIVQTQNLQHVLVELQQLNPNIALLKVLDEVQEFNKSTLVRDPVVREPILKLPTSWRDEVCTHGCPPQVKFLAPSLPRTKVNAITITTICIQQVKPNVTKKKSIKEAIKRIKCVVDISTSSQTYNLLVREA